MPLLPQLLQLLILSRLRTRFGPDLAREPEIAGDYQETCQEHRPQPPEFFHLPLLSVQNI